MTRHREGADGVVFFHTRDIETWIDEDAPFVDLTTELLGLAGTPAVLRVRPREAVRVALTEEAARVFEVLRAQVTHVLPSGHDAEAGTLLLEVQGDAGALHRGWKVGMNLLEHGCGVATRTAAFVERARTVADVPILATRKHWPGIKKPLVKAVVAGGGHPHRLGLSETVLIFENHVRLLGGRAALATAIGRIRAAACEKKIGVECHDLAQADEAIAAGADMVQFDKVPAALLAEMCTELKRAYPSVTLLAAGGIDLGNVEAYAASGVDGIVLSSIYDAKPSDLGVTIEAA